MSTRSRTFSLLAVAGAAAIGLAGCGGSSSSGSTSTSSSPAATNSSSSTSPSASPNASSSAPALSAGATLNAVGGTTTLDLASAAATTLKTLGVSIAAASPATAQGNNAYLFPITGGTVSEGSGGSSAVTATLKHSGGLTFSFAGKSLTANDFVVDLANKKLTGVIAGQRVTLFDLNENSLNVQQGSGTVTLTGIDATLDPQFLTKLGAPSTPTVTLGSLTSKVNVHN